MGQPTRPTQPSIPPESRVAIHVTTCNYIEYGGGDH